MHRWVVGVVVVVVASSGATAAPERTLTGVVIDVETGAPITDAILTTKHGAIATASDGAFSIPLATDEDALVVTAPGYVMRTFRIVATTGLRIALTPSHELIEISGRAPRAAKPLPPVPPPFRVATDDPAAGTSYSLSATDLRALPGTANDALRAAQVLPGVARLPFSFGGVVLRGAAPRDSVVFLDGIEVPHAFHFGGVTSFYPSGMLSDLVVRNSGLDADTGRASGGSSFAAASTASSSATSGRCIPEESAAKSRTRRAGATCARASTCKAAT